mgnify:CR=1 FL=1
MPENTNIKILADVSIFSYKIPNSKKKIKNINHNTLAKIKENEINFNDFNSYIENLACALLHEACHNKLYVESMYENKNPHTAAGGYSGEMYCLTRQIECLKRLGAPWDLILNYIDYYEYDWWSEPGNLKRIKKH